MFQDYNALVHRIFPSIYEISVCPSESNSDYLEVFVRTDQPDSRRMDLAIPLNECGTGVGQVLAMLYVAMTAQYPQVIIIDEPSSFLHPSAARKLIECLKVYPQHQYIVSTHSPEILRAADPQTLIFIRWQRPASVVEVLSMHNLDDLRKLLMDVGAKPSDVFGADRILWVEGETEELCLPLVLQGHPELAGTNIVRIRHTGDFGSKRLPPELIEGIYRNLSRGKTIVPPAVAFVFDRESRSDSEMVALMEKTKGRVRFLSRSMFENFLLVPEAIAAVMNQLESFRECPVTEVEVKRWLMENGGKAKYTASAKAIGDVADQDWVKSVHASRLLGDLFQEFSSARYAYQKPTHSFLLTQWLVINMPEALGELKAFFLEILSSVDKELTT